MDLERNLIDNILECEIKLGHASLAISFYYPKNSLFELLDCIEQDLDKKIKEFQEKELEKLGYIEIKELPNEKGRYGVTIPAKGVDFVSSNYVPTDFMKSFVHEIKKTGSTLDSMKKFFEQFSEDVVVEKVNNEEWAIWFQDESIDPYVYYIEQNLFGLEYHRFTKKAYEELGVLHEH